MGGKTTQSTQQVTIPPEVLARYNSVNATAEQAAQNPFQQYGGEFVAPINQQQQAGIAATNTAANMAHPYYDTANTILGNAYSSATPYYGSATQNVYNAQNIGDTLAGQSYSTLQGANAAAAPFQAQAGQAYNEAYGSAKPLNASAASAYYGGYGSAQPLQGAAAQGLSNAYAGAQPYQQVATGLAGAGAGAVNAQQIGANQINQFMSPYLGTVLGSESALLNQNNQQAMAGQLGNAISSGAFGGDRGGIAAANLAQQQQLANANIYSGILNQGYGQALSAAQQQQGVNLGAAQANRAALQNAAGQFASIGQQGYAQGTGTAQAQAALGQQMFGQGQALGSNLAGLGNQMYTQGMGLGSAQQGLGQQEFAQGATTAAQQAALGQQQFAQGLSAAQQQQALGQGMYTMGADTSAALANLGTQAQTSALQGSQAQTAAGTLQQQTQQAEDTAKYNQFLQQQSYPFQTAQFLANIAEGTGSLSGSTTATSQPGGFFSDERLKENIKEVGRTNDGQKIYSYNYKGDNRTQIGLLAQEVEKKHPEAVGLASGYKTVDYDAATKDAQRTKRSTGGLIPESEGGSVHFGHAGEGYADGGMPMLPGLSPTDYSALLQAQQAMYAPFGGGGLYGGGASGVPHGGAGYVPQANLPVSHLTTAGALTPNPSALDQMHKFADIGNDVKSWLPKKESGLSQDAQDMHTKILLGGGGDSAGDPTDKFFGLGQARGGVAGGRHPFADGGMPYSNQGGPADLDIPDQTPQTHQIATAGALPKQQSGLDQLGGLAGDVSGVIGLGKDVAGLAPGIGAAAGSIGSAIGSALPFLAALSTGGVANGRRPHHASGGVAGGRRGYDDGGDVSAPLNDPGNPMDDAGPVDLDRPWSEADAETAAHIADPHGIMTSEARTPSHNADVGGTPDSLHLSGRAFDRVLGAGTSESDFLDRVKGLGAPVTQFYGADYARQHGENPHVHVGWANSPPLTPAGVAPSSAPSPAPQDTAGVAPPSGESLLAQKASAGLNPADVRNIRQSISADNSAPPSSDFLHTLAKRENLIPLLTGLAAMGTAPTRSLGVALASGVGAGAQSYMKTQQQIAEQAKTQAETEEARAQAGNVGATAQQTRTGTAGVQIKNYNDFITGLYSVNTARRLSNLPPLTEAQYAHQIGLQGPPEATGAAPNAAAVTPAAPNTAAPNAAQGAPTSWGDVQNKIVKYGNSEVRGNNDPATLRQFIADNSAAAAVSPIIAKQVEAAQKALDYIKANGSKTYDTSGNEVYIPGALSNAATAERQSTEITAETSVAQAGKQAIQGQQVAARQSAYDLATQGQQTLSQTQAMLANLKDPKTGKYNISGGPLGNTLTNLSGVLNQFGIPQDVIKAITKTDPNDAAAIQKLKTTLGTEIGRQELAGSPVRVAEWQQFLSTTPGGDLPNAAAEWILKNIIQARAQQSIDLYQRVRKMDPVKGEDIQGAIFDFQKDHPWYNPKAGGAGDVKTPSDVPKDKSGAFLPQKLSDMKGQPKGTPFLAPGDPKIRYYTGD